MFDFGYFQTVVTAYRRNFGDVSVTTKDSEPLRQKLPIVGSKCSASVGFEGITVLQFRIIVKCSNIYTICENHIF
jgi:hypothetical protein